jgi:hypothetical protein
MIPCPLSSRPIGNISVSNLELVGFIQLRLAIQFDANFINFIRWNETGSTRHVSQIRKVDRYGLFGGTELTKET